MIRLFTNKHEVEFGSKKLEFLERTEAKTPLVKITGNGNSFVAIDIKGRVFGFGEA